MEVEAFSSNNGYRKMYKRYKYKIIVTKNTLDMQGLMKCRYAASM
jgi:hypothetical protein